MQGLVRELRKHKDAAPFLEPVDWKVLGIPDYPTIIKRPMDLGTVVRRLDANQYNNVFEVADDVDLVWTNAMTYNMDDSWIHQLAKELKGYADGKWAPLLAAAGKGGGAADAPTELNFEMKLRLNQNANLSLTCTGWSASSRRTASGRSTSPTRRRSRSTSTRSTCRPSRGQVRAGLLACEEEEQIDGRIRGERRRRGGGG